MNRRQTSSIGTTCRVFQVSKLPRSQRANLRFGEMEGPTARVGLGTHHNHYEAVGQGNRTGTRLLSCGGGDRTKLSRRQVNPVSFCIDSHGACPALCLYIAYDFILT
jgi:hypothetical protein